MTDTPPRPYIRLDQGMPERDSVAALSDAAFRLLIETICLCGRQQNDGRIPKPQLAKMGGKAAIRALVDAGHLTDTGTHWLLGDYLSWNRSAADIAAARDSVRERGQHGAHERWHVTRRVRVAGCDLCDAMPDLRQAR